MSHTFRQVTKSDFDFVYQLKKACLQEYVSATWGWDEEYQRARFQEHFDPSTGRIIVFDDQDVGLLQHHFDQEKVILDGIFIAPAFQGRGIGSAVVHDVIDAARLSRLPVELQVLKVNPARRLYEQLGFCVTGESDTHFFMQLN